MSLFTKLFSRTVQQAPRFNLGFSAGGSMPPDRNTEGFLRAYGEIGWLYAVVFRIALGCGEVKWRLYNGSERSKRTQVAKHPALSLLDTVNPFQTGAEFIELHQLYMELVGECFWILNYNRLGEPAEIWIPYPTKMSVVPDRAKFIKGYVYGSGQEAIPFETSEVIHHKYPNPLNQYRGVGPAQSIAVDLDAERYSGQWNRNFFFNSARPDGVIEFDYNLSDEQFSKLRQQWNEKYKGTSKAHQVALLEGGGKYKQIAISQKDMDFGALRKLNRDVILGVYGMPLSVMGISENVNKANAEAGDYTFARWIVKPRLDRIRNKLNEQLLPKFRKAENLELDFDEVVPETIEQKMQLAESGLRASYITRNEARQLRGMDPLPPVVGDVLLTPLNLIETPMSGAPKPPPAAVPEEEPETEPEEFPEEAPAKGKGGEGSGNFGHEGRPGEVGGSGDGGGGSKPSSGVRSAGGKANDKIAQRANEVIKTIPPQHLKYVNGIEADRDAITNYQKNNPNLQFTVGGFYDGATGKIVLGEGGGGIIDHEIGHAVHQKGMTPIQSMAVRMTYNTSVKTGKGFPSKYAMRNEREYFAESYAGYYRNKDSFSKINPVMANIIRGIK